jgi:uncharacterized hydrophobic protein (TIGR00271 family)
VSNNFTYRISNDRAFAVYNDIVVGSEPRLRFYIMVAVSTAIAAFGLIQDSPAVVIGAMLVAPLMTPIFGIALGLIRGDAYLLGRALIAEVVGVIVAVMFATILGFIMPGLEVTGEMTSRIRPNLIDLLVAIFAGFAGAYALIDENISPALPGVAISTAIVPPLANVGMCISLEAYQGALGSFLLFLANFLSILLISSIVFLYSGMSRDFPTITTKAFIRRFGIACIGFLIVTSVLGKGLYEIVAERRLTKKISTVLVEELSSLPATDIRQILHHQKDDNLYIMAHLYSPNRITPSRVSKIQRVLEDNLSSPVDLFIRTTPSNDISSSGRLNNIETQGLDGFYLNRKGNPRVMVIRESEQVIREYLQSELGMYLEEVNLIEINGTPYILATVFGPRQLNIFEIRELERKIRFESKDDLISLVLRHVKVDLYDRWGLSYLEFAELEVSPNTENIGIIVGEFLEEKFNTREHLFINTDITFRNGEYHVLVELAGTKFFTEAEHTLLQQSLYELTDHPVVLYVRSKPEVVVTKNGNISFEKLKEQMLQQLKKMHADQLESISKETL